MAVVFGNDGNNWLSGTADADVLKGFGGDDTLKGGGGADELHGGHGVDTAVYADSPAAVLIDLMQGRGYNGTASGDRFSSVENLWGSSYDDVFFGSAVANTLWGADGDDRLHGLGGGDVLDGGDGDDTLTGGRDGDALIGGVGIDTADYLASSGGVIISLLDGLALGGDAWGDTFSGIENIRGSSQFSDTLIGDPGDNVLEGWGGRDTLMGNGGADWLDGGHGADTMTGGSGNDTYVVDDAADVLVEAGGQGSDTVHTLATYVLTAGADIETLAIISYNSTHPAIDLTGNASSNAIIGNDGSNVINGHDGRDTLTGLGGQDAFLFNTPLSESVNVDTITDFNPEDDTIRLDDAIFSSSLGLGNIADGEFVIGAAAQDANDRIIYNSQNGAVLYDSDGNGGTAAIQFATLNAGLALTYLDFYVV